MATIRVTIQRTEEITFELEAKDESDAEARYLSDGEEVYSETVTTQITNVEEV